MKGVALFCLGIRRWVAWWTAEIEKFWPTGGKTGPR